MNIYDLLTSSNINTAGLVFDLIGVACVAVSFKNIRREKNPVFYLAGDENYQKKLDEEHGSLIRFDRLGMIFLIVGFVLQIVSNYIA
jgi:hypothetical protein